MTQRKNSAASAQDSSHLSAIDGLRAIALLVVIVNHFFDKALPSGFLGVDVFFVISGVPLPPLGVRKIVFTAGSDFPANGNALRVFTNALPTANSKPMLCRHYADGRFSMTHS